MPNPAQKMSVDVAAFDLATRNKIPLIQRLINAKPGRSRALDIGMGTGYTTQAVFGDCSITCIDLHLPNLTQFHRKVLSPNAQHQPHCIMAPATQLPFANDVFQYVLCSEVLEHLENDEAAVGEIARVLAPGGKVVITVPYSGFGYTGLLELLGIKTVHDYPGPEYHVRPGYDTDNLPALLERHGLSVEKTDYYLRFFTKILVDLISLAHLAYQRIVHRRKAWNWSDVANVQDGFAFKIYKFSFPILLAFSRLDRLVRKQRGFGLVVLATKRQ